MMLPWKTDHLLVGKRVTPTIKTGNCISPVRPGIQCIYLPRFGRVYTIDGVFRCPVDGDLYVLLAELAATEMVTYGRRCCYLESQFQEEVLPAEKVQGDAG